MNAFVNFSRKAIQARSTPINSFYLDMGWLGQYWNCYPGKARVYHHTGPVNALYGLREGLAMLAEEGLPACWERHRACAKLLHEGQLRLFVVVHFPIRNSARVRNDIFD